MSQRSEMVDIQPDRYLGLTATEVIIPDDGMEDPLTYKQTMNYMDHNQWVKAMDLEVESMYSNFVWTLADQPNDVKPIGYNGSTRENETMLIKYKLLRLD